MTGRESLRESREPKGGDGVRDKRSAATTEGRALLLQEISVLRSHLVGGWERANDDPNDLDDLLGNLALLLENLDEKGWR